MGEVYLAHDTQLERAVALKVLPAKVASDAERMRRFTQEAKSAAAINHPSIAHIYEIGESDGIHFISMEYVDGETLREKIHDEKAELRKLLYYLQQTAEGLSKAHAAGVVHRDLKPDNIMITRDGHAKVLDFGLAKLLERQKSMEVENDHLNGAAMKTLSQHSAPGLILGTVGYMSPEQALGKSPQIDHRSDIFSFGCVLYEAATGHRPFEADSAIESLHKVVYEPAPPLKEFNPSAPSELQRIVRRCLAKDPEERYQSIKDVAIELKELRRELEGEANSNTAVPPISPEKATTSRRPGPTFGTGVVKGAVTNEISAPRPMSSAEYLVTEIKKHRRGAVIVTATLALAVTVLTFAWYKSTNTTQTAVTGPAARVVPFTAFPGVESSPSFSPDGNQIAFSWNGEKEDNPDIYVKLIDAGTPLRLTSNPAKDEAPTFSPDGRYIAFQRTSAEHSAAYLLPALGGSERKLADLFSGNTSVNTGRLGPYSPDGKFLVVSDKELAEEPFAIYLIAIETGERRKLTSPPAGSVGDGSPAFSPDGKWLAFIRAVAVSVADLYVMPTAGGEMKRLTFDKTGMGVLSGIGVGGLTWTTDGREIIFSSLRGGSVSHLWRVAASGGKPVRIEGAGPLSFSPSVSPRGGRLAYMQSFNDLNIWRVPLGEDGRAGPPTRFISSTLVDDGASYSPDGRKIVFASTRSGSSEIWVCEADGTKPVRLTNFGGPVTGSPRWSPDGRWIAFDTRVEGNPDIFVISSEGGKPRRLTTEASEDIVPSWSRDGRFIYFSSTRSGSLQIWKVPAEGGEARQLTKGGGFEGYESADGKYIYYRRERYQTVPGLWRVPVEGGEETRFFDQHRIGIWRSWTITEGGIFFVTGETATKTVIEYYSFATGDVKPVAVPEKQILPTYLGLSVSPDGRWLLYTQADQRGSDLMLVENFR
jgi:Tol biopolymer transport system component/tRNA A-37 threonylcarbamoyl transferase component Bud32